MTVTAVDAAGNPATGFLGTVFLTTNDPAVTSTFAYTFTAADAGTHSFTGSIRLVTPGNETVTVAAPRMTASSSTVFVTPAVSKLDISAPTASTAGDTFNVTVTAIDQLGGVGTGYTSTIHFASSDVQAGLPADYTFTSADAGVHTFSVTLKSAGSMFLSATEVGGTVTGGAFVNLSWPAHQLHFHGGRRGRAYLHGHLQDSRYAVHHRQGCGGFHDCGESDGDRGQCWDGGAV